MFGEMKDVVEDRGGGRVYFFIGGIVGKIRWEIGLRAADGGLDIGRGGIDIAVEGELKDDAWSIRCCSMEKMRLDPFDRHELLFEGGRD